MIRAYVEPIGTGAAVFLLLAVMLWLPYTVWQYRRRGELSGRRALAQGTFLLYLLCAWALVLLPFPARDAAVRSIEVQLVPFQWVADVREGLARNSQPGNYQPGNYRPGNYQPGNYQQGVRALLTNAALLVRIFNVFLTVPFGVFLRRWFRRGFWTTTLAGCGLSLAFELTQLTGIWGIYPHPYRTFDVDDLLANTLGASLGWFLAPIVFVLPKRRASDDEPVNSEDAGLYRRFAGLLIDAILWAGTYVTALFASFAVLAMLNREVRPATLSLVFWVLSFLLVFLCGPLLLRGSTPGMALVRLSLRQGVDPTRRAPWWRILLRQLLLFAPLAGLGPVARAVTGWQPEWMPLAALLAYLLAWPMILALSTALSRHRRSLVDVLAGTVVCVVSRESATRLALEVPAHGD